MRQLSVLFISIILLTACGDDAEKSIKERFKIACAEAKESKFRQPTNACNLGVNITDEKKEEFIIIWGNLKKAVAAAKDIPVSVRFEVACDGMKEQKMTTPDGACSKDGLSDEQKMLLVDAWQEFVIAKDENDALEAEGRAKGYIK
jgi:hypothetical protein